MHERAFPFHLLNSSSNDLGLCFSCIFICTIHEVVTVINGSKIELFADDTMLYVIGNDLSQMKHIVNNDLNLDNSNHYLKTWATLSFWKLLRIHLIFNDIGSKVLGQPFRLDRKYSARLIRSLCIISIGLLWKSVCCHFT